MIRKLLTSAAATALAAGAANALSLENLQSLGNADNPRPIAAQLDFVGTDAVNDTILIGIVPDANFLPSGDLVVSVSMTGAALSAAVGTDAIVGCVTAAGTPTSGNITTFTNGSTPCSVLGSFNASTSTGGAAGDTEVVLLVDGLEVCGLDATGTAGADTYEAQCAIQLPVILDGSDVSVSVGIETDDNDPVNGSSGTSPISAPVFQIEDAYDIDVTPSQLIADVNATDGPFTDFVAGSLLGTLSLAAHVVELSGGDMPTVDVSLTGGADPVTAGNIDDIEVTVTGVLDAFDPEATPSGDIQLDGTTFEDVDTDDNEAFDNDIALAFDASIPVTLDADEETAIVASVYTFEFLVEAAATGDPIELDQSLTGVLGAVVRNGTTVTFPWTQSQTQGSASGTISVFRLGNLDSSPSGTVFVEVENSTEAGYMNPGIVELADAIPVDGEFVINSSGLEEAVGNYGRGDVTFTVEADPGTLTGRQFVVRGDVIQQVSGGNIDEDLDD